MSKLSSLPILDAADFALDDLIYIVDIDEVDPADRSKATTIQDLVDYLGGGGVPDVADLVPGTFGANVGTGAFTFQQQLNVRNLVILSEDASDVAISVSNDFGLAITSAYFDHNIDFELGGYFRVNETTYGGIFQVNLNNGTSQIDMSHPTNSMGFSIILDTVTPEVFITANSHYISMNRLNANAFFRIGGLDVSFGANDSAGAGFRTVRVPNA